MRIVLMYSTHTPSADHIGRLSGLGSNIEVVVARDEPHAIESCQQADIILGHRYLRQVLPDACRLRFVQSTAAGVDRLPIDALAQKGVRLCRSTVSSSTIARHAMACAWAITRQLHIARDRQNDQRWEQGFDWPTQPRSALVVGAGSIGTAIARLLAKEGIEAVGIRASAEAPAIDGFSSMHSPKELAFLLPQCDWCFLSLPLTEQTCGQFDHAMLSRLKHSAVLVNVGRGELIDTLALCGLMKGGRLAGAALDVLEPAAKATDHPVWTTPRVLITPHVSSHSAERAELNERFAEQQVQAYLKGLPLLDEVNLLRRRDCA